MSNTYVNMKSMNTLAKKTVGTAFIGALFVATSFIGISVANAYFVISGKNVEMHAVVQAKTASTLTLLTSSTDPIVVETNSKTKYVGGTPAVGDYVYVVGRVQDGSNIRALVVKKSQSGGPDDVYGTEGDTVVVDKATFVASTYPWLRVTSPLGGGTTIVFRINNKTNFVGVNGFSNLQPGDILTVSGKDTNQNGFVAKTVVKKNSHRDRDD
jgi:hypothetical protein